jgi:ABC-type transport system involved in Fe-S cluster assembly fused permease/ATPase subunit
MHTWVDLIDRFFSLVLPNFVIIILSIIFIALINIYYALIVIILLFFIILITIIVQNKAKIFRRSRKKHNISITRKFVNVLMNKFEILQNNK